VTIESRTYTATHKDTVDAKTLGATVFIPSRTPHLADYPGLAVDNGMDDIADGLDRGILEAEVHNTVLVGVDQVGSIHIPRLGASINAV